MYVYNTYEYGYNPVQAAYSFETFAVCFFIADFALSSYINMNNLVAHLANFYSVIDMLTIIPYFLQSGSAGSLMVFRVLKILRLLRIIKTSRVLNGVKVP
jgi:hypothetical protein